MGIENRIKSIRGSLPQKDFADKIGVHITTIQGYEKGNLPKGDILQRIHDVFHVDINWLLTGEGEPYKDMVADGLSWIKESSVEYSQNPNGDPFADAVSGLKKIYDSRDPLLIPLIDANIRAFRNAAKYEKIIIDQDDKIKAQGDYIKALQLEYEDLKKLFATLRSEHEDLFKRFIALEKKYKLIAPQPAPDEAAV